MKKLILFFLLFGCAVSYGQPAPDFTITSSTGEEINLYADYLDQDKTVLLELFWEGCPPCNSFAPLLGDLYKEWGDGNGDVEFIALDILSNETDEDVIAFQDRHGHTWPGASAEGGSLDAIAPYTSGTAYGTYLGTPTIVIIGPDKTVAYNVNGFMRNDNGIAILDEAITATGAQKMAAGFATATVTGVVENSSQVGVGNVAIKFSGGTDAIVLAEANGRFSLPDLPIDQAYTVTPEKNTAIDNGVTTMDLILIGRHILGTAPFTEEAQIIAADANLSESVTTFDIVLLQRAILGIDSDLPAGSWRFIPGVIELSSLNDLSELSFLGVKIGDVDNSADPSVFLYNETRSAKTISILVENKPVLAGEIVEVSFAVKKETDLLGFQFTLDFDSESLQLLGVSETAIPNFGDANMNIQHQERGQIPMSWYDLSDASVTDLFSLTFKANQSGALKDLLEINSAITPAEAYTTSEDIVDINLQFTANDVTNSTISIHPNPIKEEMANISLYIDQQSDLEIELIRMDGRTSREFSYVVEERGLQSIRLETGSLEAGIYVVNVKADGRLLERAKFIKQ